MSLTDQEVAQIQFQSISKTATGDLVSAVTGKKIRVLTYTIVSSAGTFTAAFASGTSPTNITGVMSLITGTPVTGGNGHTAPAFETASGEKLSVVITGTGQLSGHLSYVLVDG